MHRPHTQIRVLAALCITLGAVVAPGAAQAQPADPQKVATSKALYDQATAEMNRGDYASACPRLEEVVKLIPDGIGAMLTLAACYEGGGRLLSAWSQYTVAQGAATAAGQADRAKRAGAKVAMLQARLPKVAVSVPEAVRSIPGIQVLRDGAPLGAVHWGVAVPVDPGPHEVVVVAPGRKAWRQKTTVAEAATLTVDVPLLEVESAAPPSPEAPKVSAVTPAPVPMAPPPPAAESGSTPWQKPVGLSAAGLGAVGFGIGAALGIAANSKWNDSTRPNDAAYCDTRNVCGPAGMSMRNSVYSMASGATAAFVAGSVLVGGGAILYFTAPRSSTRVGLAPSGVLVEGTW